MGPAQSGQTFRADRARAAGFSNGEVPLRFLGIHPELIPSSARFAPAPLDAGCLESGGRGGGTEAAERVPRRALGHAAESAPATAACPTTRKHMQSTLLKSNRYQNTVSIHRPSSSRPTSPPGSTCEGEAHRYLERAAYLNFSPAQYKLGHAYEFAQPPFPFDALLSVQYYSLASQQGKIKVDMALSKWFLCGAEGSFDKDEALAFMFAEKAARKGLPSAEFAMGYYMEAAQHGNADATEWLSTLDQAQALSCQEHDTLTEMTL
ncbi:hypothetical protein EW146_g2404, partial [Bondarzewia mesenterica]